MHCRSELDLLLFNVTTFGASDDFNGAADADADPAGWCDSSNSQRPRLVEVFSVETNDGRYYIVRSSTVARSALVDTEKSSQVVRR